jgi:5-methylcytosine-specific restriction protein A
VPRALRQCPVVDCYELVVSGRCPAHTRAADVARGTPAQRGYGHAWEHRWRPACLRRDPLCTCHDQGHEHGYECLSPSTVADHYPTSRKDLVAQGVPDPDALHRLRGVCKPCHDAHTAEELPGGWHRRDSQ